MSVATAHSPSQSFDDTLTHRPIPLVHHASSPAIPQANLTTTPNPLSPVIHSSATATTSTTSTHTNTNNNNDNSHSSSKSPATTLTPTGVVDPTHYHHDDSNTHPQTQDEQAQPASDLSPPTTPVPSNPYATDPRDPLSLPQPSTASKRSFATSSSTNVSCHKESIPPSQHSRALTIDSAESEPVRPPYTSSTISSASSDVVSKDMRLPKRYSTSHNLHAKRVAAAANKSRALTRHNTTGHPLQHPVEPERRLSEDFEKELTARRKAFRRLSRRRNDDNDEEDRVLFGTRIAEGHRNYILMYNMLTGIRIAVGRVSAKIDRPLTENDFDAAHKLAFDVYVSIFNEKCPFFIFCHPVRKCISNLNTIQK